MATARASSGTATRAPDRGVEDERQDEARVRTEGARPGAAPPLVPESSTAMITPASPVRPLRIVISPLRISRDVL